MKQLRGSIYQPILFVLSISIFSLFFAIFPVKAFALDAATQTAQVLPVGGNACVPVSATNFTPYVYNGALHSFEFTISDDAYVSVLGSIGNTPLSFRLMTRMRDASGMLRVHVDVETTPIVGTLPLSVTLLSARSGSPVCLTVVSVGVGSGPITIQNNPLATIAPATTQPSTAAAPTKPSATITSAPQKPASTDPIPTTDKVLTTSTSEGSVIGFMKNPFLNVCASDVGAYRLWLILLVLFMVIVGAALWAEFPMSVAWARTPERIATIILVLLLLLLTFWYFSISCRAALWMPLMAFLVAVLGLLAAFWNHPRVTQMLLIQETKTSATSNPVTKQIVTSKQTPATIVTPPPAKK